MREFLIYPSLGFFQKKKSRLLIVFVYLYLLSVKLKIRRYQFLGSFPRYQPVLRIYYGNMTAHPPTMADARVLVQVLETHTQIVF